MPDYKLIPHGTRVLVLDDDHGIRSFLLESLIHRGCKAIGTMSVREAFQTLEDFNPHVIISDIQMPGEDGFAFIQQLRSRSPSQGGNIPVIAVSGSGISEQQLLETGFQAFLPKPVNMPMLAQIIAELVRTQIQE